MNERALIVDGNAIFRRFFHIIKDGVYKYTCENFISFVKEKGEKCGAKYLYCIFDNKGETFRNKIYPEYKAGRKKEPEFENLLLELSLRLKNEKGILTRTAPPEYEADDVIGTIAKGLEKKELNSFIMTTDHDFLQLINEKISVHLIGGGKNEDGTRTDITINVKNIEKFKGVRAEQFLDFKTMVGDTSDNIKGIKTIGDKTAIKILKKYDNLTLFLCSGSISTKYKEEQESDSEFLKRVYLERELMRIVTTVPKEKIIKGLNRELI